MQRLLVDAQGDTMPQLWRSTDAGSTWEREALPLLVGGTQGWANGVVVEANAPEVVGCSEVIGGSRHAVVWKSPDGGQNWTVTDLGVLSGLPNSEALAVTAFGVGKCYVGRSYGVLGTARATIWIDDGAMITMKDLNDLVVDTSPYVLRSATGVGVDLDGGLSICGIGTDAAAVGRGVAGPHAYVAVQAAPTGIGEPSVRVILTRRPASEAFSSSRS